MKRNITSTEIIDNYLSNNNNIRTWMVKPEVNSSNYETYYTDGTVRSYDGDPNAIGVGGYAWIREGQGQDRHYYRQSCNGLTIDQVEAEAILSCLRSVGSKTNVRLVTDSRIATVLVSDTQRMDELESLSPEEVKELPWFDKKLVSLLDYREKILSEIQSNINIQGVSIEWVKSHTMDHLKKSKITTNHANHHNRLFNNIVGNKLADSKATEAVAFTLRRLADVYLSDKIRTKEYDNLPSKEDFKGLLNQSLYTRSIIIDYVAKRGIGKYSKNNISDLFSDNGETYGKMIEGSSLHMQIDLANKEDKFDLIGRYKNIIGKPPVYHLFVDGKNLSGYNQNLKEVDLDHKNPHDMGNNENERDLFSAKSREERINKESQPSSDRVKKFSGKYSRFGAIKMNQGYIDKITKDKDTELGR